MHQGPKSLHPESGEQPPVSGSATVGKAAGGSALVRRFFLIALAVLVPVFGVATYQAVERYSDAAKEVDHTYNVIIHAQEFLSLLKDVETGHRGYLLTGQREFLQPFEDATRALPAAGVELRTLISGNPKKILLVDKIRRLADDKVTMSRRSLALYDGGDSPAAYALVATGEGRRIMDEVRDLIAQTDRTEQSLLRQRSAQATLQSEQTHFLLQLGGSILFVLVVLAALALEWDSRRRQKAAAVLAEQRERMRVALLNVPLTLCTTDTEFKYTWIYRPGEEAGAPDSIGTTELETMLMGGARELIDLKNEVLATGKGGRRELRMAKDGRTTVHDVAVEPIRAAGGREITGLTVAALNVTSRVEQGDALRRSEAQFRQIIDSMPQLVWSTLPDGQPDIFNSRWFEYTGLSFEESVAGRWISLLHADERDLALTRWRQSIQTGELFEIEFRFRRYDGDYRWFLSRGQAVRDEVGKVARWFGTSTEIQAQKVAETGLRLANEDLESFAFAAAHDLQEPLRTITIHSQMLLRKLTPGLDATSRELLEDTIAAGKRTTMLLRDLLAYAELGSRDDLKEVEAVSLDDALAVGLGNLKTAIAESGARIQSDPLPVIHGRKAHAGLLFQNLIGNAIKYSGGERPEVHITCENRGSEWIIRIADKGLGIAKEHQKSVFGVFKRLHGSKIPGTGIGLALCQRVVERMGGSIWVESEGDGHGSTFCFSVPVVRAEAAHAGNR